MSCLPALKILDDEPLLVERMDGKEVKRVNPKAAKRQMSPFENDLRIVEVSLKSLEVDENSENTEGINNRAFALLYFYYLHRYHIFLFLSLN